MALVIRSASGGSQKLSLDNFVAIHHGRSSLANLQGVTGNSIEWVKDDQDNLQSLSAPGYYIVKITDHKINENSFMFTIDPYLLVYDEELNIQFLNNTEGAILQNLPVNPGSEIVFSGLNKFDFKRDIDYTINYQTGEILFKESVKQYAPILVDYQFLGSQQGPFETEYYKLNNTVIPGIILAFGDRLNVGDEQVVIIEKKLGPIAKVFGGRWMIDINIIGVAQDPDQQERLVDYVVTSLWANYQDELSNEGIVIRDFTLSGEAEDLEVEIPEEYNFTGGISFSMETDWEIYVPMISTLRRVIYSYGEGSFKDMLGNYDEKQYTKNEYDKRMSGSDHPKGIQVIPSLDCYQISPSVFSPKVKSRQYPQ